MAILNLQFVAIRRWQLQPLKRFFLFINISFVSLISLSEETAGDILKVNELNKNVSSLCALSFFMHGANPVYDDGFRLSIYQAPTCTCEDDSGGILQQFKSCPPCQSQLSPEVEKCTPYVVDEDCPASLDYYEHKNLKWVACHNHSAVGVFSTTRRPMTCYVALKYSSSKPSTAGLLACCADQDFYEASLGWGIMDGNENMGFAVPGFLHVETDPPCIHATNDGTCTIPHFSHNALQWNWCVKGHGLGVFTTNLDGEPLSCAVRVASESPYPCASKTKSCGVITCAKGLYNNPLCQGSWNMPDKPKFFELPLGCLTNSNPSAYPDTNSLTLPLSIAGAVVFTGIVSVVTTAAVCVCYSSYKRRGYQSIQGAPTN